MPTRPTLSVVTVAKLYAVARGSREDNARRSGEWLKHYRGSHGIDDLDPIIAATAEQHGLPLATLNLKHFPKFPELNAAY
jgi:predicted nucleic acid-binding protein